MEVSIILALLTYYSGHLNSRLSCKVRGKHEINDPLKLRNAWEEPFYLLLITIAWNPEITSTDGER